MKFIVPAVIFFLVLNAAYAGKGECPKECRQETGDRGQAVCNCCHEDPSVLYVGPCASVRCAGGPCVDTMCDEPGCGDEIHSSCRKFCGYDEPSSCGENEFLVYNSSGCKVCKKIEEGVVDPCAKEGACKEGEECRRNEVFCKKAPCPPTQECRKICPEIVCMRGCFEYEDRDGCHKCKCCKNDM